MKLFPTERLIERFWTKIDKGDDCWLWLAAVNDTGYGQFAFQIDGKVYNWKAHRLSYELLVGPIPDGHVIDHLCRVRACVRPDHLEAVTPAENTRRSVSNPSAINGRRVQCTAGHPFDEANTYVAPNGTRHCRKCRNRRTAESHRRQRVGMGG